MASPCVENASGGEECTILPDCVIIIPSLVRGRVKRAVRGPQPSTDRVSSRRLGSIRRGIQ